MRPVSRWIAENAAATPDKPAIIFEGEKISYAELAKRIDICAASLSADFSIKRGDRVAYLGLNSPQFLMLFFACARLGAIFLPLNWRLAVPEHQFILENASPRLCVYEEDFQQAAEALGDALETCRFVPADDVTLADPSGLGDRNLLGACEDNWEDTPLLLVYTSGTTGHPKGAVLSQGAIYWNALNSLHMHDMSADDRILTVLPMFHVGGLNIQTTPALYCGATVDLHRRFSPTATLSAFQETRPTLVVLVPATISALLSDSHWTTTDLASLRAVATGSSVVPIPLIEAFHERGVPVLQVYGSTETCPIAIYLKSADAMTHVGSTGKPGRHCGAKVINDHGEDLGPNQSGEILVSGRNIMMGYWQNPEGSAQCLKDGWFATGDVGYVDENGFFYVNDRKKDVIISGGENIYPAELELVLSEIPGIRQAAVVGRDDLVWGQVPVAVVVPDGEATFTREDILYHFNDRLARFKHPKDVVFLDRLPTNAMGKIQKFAVRELIRNGPKD